MTRNKEISDEEFMIFVLKSLARAEQLIDSGKYKHIKTVSGIRLPVPDRIMNQFDLIDGQTVSSPVLFEALKEAVINNALKEHAQNVADEVIKNAMGKGSACNVNGNKATIRDHEYEWPQCFITGIVELKSNNQDERIMEACEIGCHGWNLVHFSNNPPANFGKAMAELGKITGCNTPDDFLRLSKKLTKSSEGNGNVS